MPPGAGGHARGGCYPKENILIDLFDSGSGSCTGGCTCTWHTSSTWGHTSGHTTWGTSSCLVKLGDDWVANAFNLLLFVFVFILLGSLVSVEPSNDLIALVHDGFPFSLSDFVLQLFVLNCGLHVEAVGFQTVLGGDTFFLLIIFSLELLCIRHHTFDILLGQASLVIGDGNLFLFTGRLVYSGNVQDTIGVNVESDLNLGHTTGCR